MSSSPHPAPRPRRPSQSQWGPSPLTQQLPLTRLTSQGRGPSGRESSGSREVDPLGATAMPGAAGVLLVLLLSGGLGGGQEHRLQQLPQAHQQRGTVEAWALDHRLSRPEAAHWSLLPTVAVRGPLSCCPWGALWGEGLSLKQVPFQLPELGKGNRLSFLKEHEVLFIVHSFLRELTVTIHPAK